jgi:integrase
LLIVLTVAVRKRIWTAPDGTIKQAWLVDYRDQAGKRRAKQFARKKDADAWEVKTAGEVVQGVHTPDSASVSVEKAATLWLDSIRSAGREVTTTAAYEQHIRLHIIPLCGAAKLSQLTAPRVRQFLDQWLQELSRPMAVRVLRTFKAILTDAQERGLVAQNVALAVKPRKQARDKAKAVPPSKSDLRAILKAAEASGDVMGRALIELAIFSGLRASELRGLPWSAIDMKRKVVAVEQRADAMGIIGPPKSAAGRRTVPLPERVITNLKAWKLACPPHAADLVFPSIKGKPLSHRVMMSNHVDSIIAAARVTSTGMHVFRHAAASLWIEQGLNPKRVQQLMGHSSVQVTFDVYGHLFPDAEKDAGLGDAIERALFDSA